MSFPHHRWSRPGEVWGAASGQGTDEALAIQTSVPGPLSRDVRGEGFTPREARGGPPHNHRHSWPAAIQAFCSTGPARPSLRGRGHVAAGQAPAVVAALYVDHGRAVENRAAEIGSGHGGVAEIRTPEIGAVQVRIAEVGTDQDGANEDGGLADFFTGQVDLAHVGPDQGGSGQVGVDQARAEQRSASEIGPNQRHVGVASLRSALTRSTPLRFRPVSVVFARSTPRQSGTQGRVVMGSCAGLLTGASSTRAAAANPCNQ